MWQAQLIHNGVLVATHKFCGRKDAERYIAYFLDDRRREGYTISDGDSDAETPQTTLIYRASKDHDVFYVGAFFVA